MGLKKLLKYIVKLIDKRLFYLKVKYFGHNTCTPGTPRCKYHQPCCKENLKTILEYTHNLLSENNIKYWIDYGTLLVAVRGKDLIDYDTDIDIDILYKDKAKLISLEKRIIEDGFHFSKDGTLDFYRIGLSKINTLHVDIFIWLEREDGKLCREEYMSKDKKKGRDFPAEWIKELSMIEIDGRQYFVPANPALFCEFRFGKNWQTPIKVRD